MIARCDYCAGSANWTFIDGVVHYHCLSRCVGFEQIELPLDGCTPHVYIDSVRSVSGLAEAEDPDVDDPDYLPF